MAKNPADADRRDRLHALVTLARVTRGWSRARLAKELRRDPTKIYPESGNPKSDFVFALASVLEWRVGDVLEYIWGDASDAAGGPTLTSSRRESAAGLEDASYESLYTHFRELHLRGEYSRTIDVAKRMYDAAPNVERKAFACTLEASGWDGLGQFTREVDACQRGLAHRGVSAYTRNILRANLANAWYCLGELTPALGTAEILAQHYESAWPDETVQQKRPAFVYYVRGNVLRRLAIAEPESRDDHLCRAEADLSRAAELYDAIAADVGDPSLEGIANTCRGGLLEIAVERGDGNARATVAEMMGAVDAAMLKGDDEIGDRLESHGWWCIFACNIALRHLQGREMQHAVNRLTDQALTIADKLGNWAMRERVFVTRYQLRETLSEATGLDIPMPIADGERKLISAAMGRFPSFRTVGWSLLEAAGGASAETALPARMQEVA